MGPTTFNGLPIHPLLVHFVVVLVPLASLLLLLSLCWPAARRRLGAATPFVAFVTLVLVPVTTHAGEWLEERTPRDPLVRIHAELGDQLLVWSIGVFLVALAWWLVHEPRAQRWWTARVGSVSDRSQRIVAAALIVLGFVVGVGSVVQVYRIGESGAKAVWSTSDQPDAVTS